MLHTCCCCCHSRSFLKRCNNLSCSSTECCPDKPLSMSLLDSTQQDIIDIICTAHEVSNNVRQTGFIESVPNENKRRSHTQEVRALQNNLVTNWLTLFALWTLIFILHSNTWSNINRKVVVRYLTVCCQAHGNCSPNAGWVPYRSALLPFFAPGSHTLVPDRKASHIFFWLRSRESLCGEYNFGPEFCAARTFNLLPTDKKISSVKTTPSFFCHTWHWVQVKGGGLQGIVISQSKNSFCIYHPEHIFLEWGRGVCLRQNFSVGAWEGCLSCHSPAGPVGRKLRKLPFRSAPASASKFIAFMKLLADISRLSRALVFPVRDSKCSNDVSALSGPSDECRCWKVFGIAVDPRLELVEANTGFGPELQRWPVRVKLPFDPTNEPDPLSIVKRLKRPFQPHITASFTHSRQERERGGILGEHKWFETDGAPDFCETVTSSFQSSLEDCW